MSLWARLRQSFWFLPALLCLGAVVLAEGLIYVDQRLGDSDLAWLDFLITRVGESGSRDLLGAIAGSMLTVASTTFSITIAVLALSSSTYGPRLVRNFMADRGNQLVLGIFVATFLYSLLVLRSIRTLDDGTDNVFVPHLAVNVAVLLAVLSIGVLVYFIHHISDSVQVWTLAEQVRTDLLAVIDRLYPEDGDREPRQEGAEREAELPARLGTDGVPLTSARAGYVQGVDLDRLLGLAHEHDRLVSMEVGAGEHVTEGAVVARLWPPGELDDDLRDAARAAVPVGRARTPQSDVAFPALLLEEMAVRALSPSTNDPYTAINALDNLADGLAVLAGRPVPSSHRYDDDGRLRVVAPSVSFMQPLEHLLDAIRFYATGHPTVLHQTLELVDQVGAACHDPAARLQLITHLDRLVEGYSATTPQREDLEALTRHAGKVRGSLVAPAV